MSSANKKKSGTAYRKSARVNGKCISAYGATVKEAQRKLDEKVREAQQGIVGGSMLVDAWFSKWMDLYRRPLGVSQKRLEEQESLYRRIISPAIGKMKLSSVREVHLQQILNSQPGHSHAYYKNLYEIMHGMFARANSSRMILFDPSAHLIFPASADSKGRRSLTEEEQEVFKIVAKTHKRGPWILTMLYAGMRPGETATLIWNDVDFERNEIHVHTARAAASTEIKGPKSEAGYRDIPMHADLRAVLLPLAGDPFALVFPSSRGGVAHNDTMKFWWETFVKAVNVYLGAKTSAHGKVLEPVLATDLTAYCLRHTFCTNCERSGVPIDIAKRYMGHARISTTADIYTHTDNDTLHKYMRLMDGSSDQDQAKQQ